MRPAPLATNLLQAMRGTFPATSPGTLPAALLATSLLAAGCASAEPPLEEAERAEDERAAGLATGAPLETAGSARTAPDTTAAGATGVPPVTTGTATTGDERAGLAVPDAGPGPLVDREPPPRPDYAPPVGTVVDEPPYELPGPERRSADTATEARARESGWPATGPTPGTPQHVASGPPGAGPCLECHVPGDDFAGESAEALARSIRAIVAGEVPHRPALDLDAAEIEEVADWLATEAAR